MSTYASTLAGSCFESSAFTAITRQSWLSLVLCESGLGQISHFPRKIALARILLPMWKVFSGVWNL